MKGLLSALAGAADELDFIPGFDPRKDQQGMISKLMSGGQKPTGQSYQPQLDALLSQAGPTFERARQAAAGPAPMNAVQKRTAQGMPPARINPPNPAGYLKSHSILDVLNPFYSTVNQDLDAAHRYRTDKANYEAQQAQMADQRQTAEVRDLGTRMGLKGPELARFEANPEEFLKVHNVTRGSRLGYGGGELMGAYEGTELTADAAGRPIIADLDNQTFSAPQGPAKPVSLASGAQAIDPITNEVIASNTGMTDYQRAQIENERAQIAASENETDVSGESALRKEFLSQNKGFQEVQRAYDRIVSTDPTNAAGQMSLIFQYMKMMDPGSTVREGEFANAQNTTGIPGQVLNAYNRAARGEYLNPTQVSEFQKQAASLYGVAANDFERSFQQYRSTASQYEYDQGRTIPDLRNPDYMEDRVVSITTDEQFDALPSGAIYQGPDGVKRRKP